MYIPYATSLISPLPAYVPNTSKGTYYENDVFVVSLVVIKYVILPQMSFTTLKQVFTKLNKCPRPPRSNNMSIYESKRSETAEKWPSAPHLFYSAPH